MLQESRETKAVLVLPRPLTHWALDASLIGEMVEVRRRIISGWVGGLVSPMNELYGLQ